MLFPSDVLSNGHRTLCGRVIVSEGRETIPQHTKERDDIIRNRME